MPLTPALQLNLKTAAEINARLAHPIEHGLKRAQFKSYPHVQGLYLLVRALGLTRLGGSPKKPILQLDDEVVQWWTDLNPTEQYGTLLETWILRGNPEILAERAAFIWSSQIFERHAFFYAKLPADTGLPIAGDKENEEDLRYFPGWFNLGLLELFGLVRIQLAPVESGKGWNIDRIFRTPLGHAVMSLLWTEFFTDLGNIFEIEDEGFMRFGVFQPVFQRYWPAWKNNLAVPEWTFREGTYTFKVALADDIWRRIVIGAKHSLDHLSSAILSSVGFDEDHLYEFSLQNRFGYTERINHPMMEEHPFTSEVKIGDLALQIGQSMTYLFDFGDNWQFLVTLENVDPNKVTKKPNVIETHGEAPEQYPDWEDDGLDFYEDEGG
jgi:hypothetical protein